MLTQVSYEAKNFDHLLGVARNLELGIENF